MILNKRMFFLFMKTCIFQVFQLCYLFLRFVLLNYALGMAFNLFFPLPTLIHPSSFKKKIKINLHF